MQRRMGEKEVENVNIGYDVSMVEMELQMNAGLAEGERVIVNAVGSGGAIPPREVSASP